MEKDKYFKDLKISFFSIVFGCHVLVIENKCVFLEPDWKNFIFG